MPTCPHCGHDSALTTPFCAGCGRSLDTEAATDAGQTLPIAAPYAEPPTSTAQQHLTRPLPPLPPPVEGSERSTISFGSERDIDWARLLRGNWLGAGFVAGTALAGAGVVAPAMVALAKPADFGVDNSLTFVALVLDGAFGASLVVRM